MKKTKTLKRLFAVALFVCLSAGQGWSGTMDISLDSNCKVENNNYQWNQDGITFTLSGDPSLDGSNNNRYKLDKNKTYKLSWTFSNTDLQVLEISKINIGSWISSFGGGIWGSSATFTFQWKNPQTNKYVSIKNEKSHNSTASVSWDWVDLDVNAGNNGELEIITSNNNVNFLFRKVEVTYTIKNKYSATVETTANEGGEVTVIGDAQQSTTDVQNSHTFSFDLNLTATPSTGYAFLNWTDESGDIISESSTFNYQPTITCTAGSLESQNVSKTIKANFEKLPTVPVGQYTYSTYVAPRDIDFTDRDVKAFAVYAKVANSMVVLEEVKKVPAGTALVVKGTYGQHIVGITDSPEEFNTDLESSSTDIVYSGADAFDYYYLGVNNGNACFKKLTSGKIAAGKCFFKVVKDGNGGAKPLIISLGDDDVTGINNIETVEEYDNVTYNIAGQRIDASTKGILIKNGKKYINK